jgi:hypothetical protein
METDMRKKKLFFVVPAAMVGIVLFMAFGGWVVMKLWNWLLPGLFGWHAITFWQALGLMVLCRILFGGLGWRGRSRSNGRKLMRERMADRWKDMTPEQRERMRNRWSAACGFEPPPPETPVGGASTAGGQ